MNSPKQHSEIPSRRRLLVGAASVGAATVLGSAAAAEHKPAWDREVDVIIVGSGAAAGAAMATAHHEGASVVVLEKAAVWGGTTGRSGGGLWVLNNRFMQQAGMADPRADALRYLARTSYPTLYAPDLPTLGLPPREYRLLEAYYDAGSPTLDYLERISAQRYVWSSTGPYDYHAELEEDKPKWGRVLNPLAEDGKPGGGDELVRQFRAYAETHGIPVLMRHRVDALEQDPEGRVLGVQATTRDGKRVRIRARRGVVFGSGGFLHNIDKCQTYLRGPVFGGGAAPSNEGDFLDLAMKGGATMGNLNEAWLAEYALEPTLESRSQPAGFWQPPGDSMIQVNRFGRRYVNEKSTYNERTRLHFVWDPVRLSYPQLVTVYLFDDRTAKLCAGIYPHPAPGGTVPYIHSGATLDELTSRLKTRLAELAHRTGGFTLDDSFASNLRGTITRYNQFAVSGVDEDFQRGVNPIDDDFHRFLSGNSDGVGKAKKRLHDYPHDCMYPLSTDGPYHAVLVVAGALDSKGGPTIDEHGRILRAGGEPIEGLYGAGNCVASPAAQGYWGAGGTIGPAVVFGHLAGLHAASRQKG